LILVDSSVWIDFFSSSPGRGSGELRRMIEDGEPLALTGVVIAEILQGLTRDAGSMEQFLVQFIGERPQSTAQLTGKASR
jgi:predicted nucleic acid-binding protein